MLRLLLSVANRGQLLFSVILADYLVCSTLYAFIEHKGPIEAMWWAIVTGFTVGYGDLYPHTTAGRGVGAFLIVSTWFLSLLAAAYITARAVNNADEFSHDEQEDIKASLQRIEAVLAQRR